MRGQQARRCQRGALRSRGAPPAHAGLSADACCDAATAPERRPFEGAPLPRAASARDAARLRRGAPQSCPPLHTPCGRQHAPRGVCLAAAAPRRRAGRCRRHVTRIRSSRRRARRRARASAASAVGRGPAARRCRCGRCCRAGRCRVCRCGRALCGPAWCRACLWRRPAVARDAPARLLRLRAPPARALHARQGAPLPPLPARFR